MVKFIGIDDFEKIFAMELSPYVKEKIKGYKFEYAELSSKEELYYLILLADTIKGLEDDSKAGPWRMSAWDSGWDENVSCYNTIPKYFGKYPVVRWNGRLIKPVSKNFEYYMLCIIQHWLFDRYMRLASSIYEFGCGTGHNLTRVKEVNKKATIYGFDWASSAVKLVKSLGFYGAQFDMFNPDYSVKIKNNSVIVTVASMEQLGTNFILFADYLINQKPNVVIHIEPINELLNTNNLLDDLSIRYAEKRNYLNGYLPYLQSLEKVGKIKLLQTQRTYIGSLFIDGYSIIVWCPV